MKLSVVIITNKEKVSSLVTSHISFAGETLIVKDKPKTNHSFAEKRNQALKKAKGDWILFVDDDEIVSRELAQELTTAIATDYFSGYFINRRDVVFNQELKHGEVGKVKILRLAKKNTGFFEREVHEVWNVKGKKGSLKSPLYHIKDNFISEFILRIGVYGPLDASSLNAEKKPFSYFKLLFYPHAKFITTYFLKLGFLDGYPGLFLSYLMSVQSLSVRIFQWEAPNS